MDEVNEHLLTIKTEKETESKIDVLDYDLIECPACMSNMKTVEGCFEHFIDHFHNSRFLFLRIHLIIWLKNYVNSTRNIQCLEIPSNKNINTTNVIGEKQNFEIDIERQVFTCLVCNKEFIDEKHLSVHSFDHLKVKLPEINSQLKCPLCEHYFSSEESCFWHILSHLKNSGVRRKGLSVLEWIDNFFCSAASEDIISRYDKYATRLNVPLFSKILVSEVTSPKFCKYCKKMVNSVFDLMENHTNCGSISISQSFYCVLCNCKAFNEDRLMEHFFLKHIICYCGFRTGTFDSFREHSIGCIAYKNGILCPICRTDTFVSIGAFKDHFTQIGRRNCSMDLRKHNWKCSLCKKQSSEKDVFTHILSEHVNCVCGYKSNDFKSFCSHSSKCLVKKNTVRCPICDQVKCSTEMSFKKHIAECLPWRRNQEEKPVVFLDEILQQGDRASLKRENDVSLEIFLKQKKVIMENI